MVTAIAYQDDLMNVQTECEYVRTRVAQKDQNRGVDSTLPLSEEANSHTESEHVANVYVHSKNKNPILDNELATEKI